MPDSYVNKVILGSEVLMDVSQDTVVANKLLYGYTAHDADGAPITGSCTFDADTSDADALIGEVISGKTFYKNGSKLTGSMTNIGQQTISISDLNASSISQGYHDGTGTAQISSTEAAKIIAENIKEGVEILGVTGTCSPASGVTAQTKSATPSLSSQTILPDSGYDYLSEVDIAAVPVTRTTNGNGICVTICPVS